MEGILEGIGPAKEPPRKEKAKNLTNGIKNKKANL